MALWDERAARNEALFREVNEKILEVDERFGSGTPSEFICECADDACVERLKVPTVVYAAVRGHSRRFIIAPDHDDPALETVSQRHEKFWVVEKYGDAGRVADRSDPRR